MGESEIKFRNDFCRANFAANFCDTVLQISYTCSLSLYTEHLGSARFFAQYQLLLLFNRYLVSSPWSPLGPAFGSTSRGGASLNPRPKAQMSLTMPIIENQKSSTVGLVSSKIYVLSKNRLSVKMSWALYLLLLVPSGTNLFSA